MVNDEEPLLKLLQELRARDYQFTTLTPSTHTRVLSRAPPAALSLRDIFGWSRPFCASDLEAPLLALLESAGALEASGGKLRSKVRVASLAGELFLHSSFPTKEHDSVFFGPDTYRFVRFVLERGGPLTSASWIVDMGAGAGAGGILAARLFPGSRVTLVDVNPRALAFSEINAAAAGVTIETVQSDRMPTGADLIIANPPYMMDPRKRAYRDGGELLGGAVALAWAASALSSLAAGGTMLLYTGVAYEAGRAPLLSALEGCCREAGATLSIEELDPDVFGEELENANYSCVERIAVVGATISVAR